jgi:hypothetical protein
MSPVLASPPAKRQFRTGWKAWQIAAAYTIVLRMVFGVYGALLSGGLYIDPHLLHSNAFTEHLMPRSNHLLYATLGIWERFDTLWYVHIAQYGYDRPASIVFYPLYPFLIHAFSWVLHQWILAALVVSTVATFFFLWGIQRLLELDYPKGTVLRTVLIAAVWPATSILLAGYAESLVLAFTVWSLYFARQDRWLIAGLLGLWAGASKAVGCFVALPLLWLGYRQKNWRAWASILAFLPAAASALWTRHSGFDSTAEIYSRYWAVRVEFPWVTLAQCVHRFLTGGFDLLFRLNFGALMVIAGLSFVKGVRAEYKIYAAGVIALFLTKNAAPLLNETMRYVLVAFPAFLGLALRVRRPVSLTLLTVFLVLVHAVLLLKFFEWSLVL